MEYKYKSLEKLNKELRGDIEIPFLKEQNEIFQSIYDNKIEKEEREEKHKQEMLLLTKNIEKNTSYLTDIVSLIKNSNDKQDEIYEIFTELLALAKLKDKESVESGFVKVIGKINNLTNNIENLEKLSLYATLLYNAIIQTF